MPITLHFCVLYGSQEKRATFALHTTKRLVFITEVECVYCTVPTESLYNTDTFRPERVNVVRSTLSSAALKWD